MAGPSGDIPAERHVFDHDLLMIERDIHGLPAVGCLDLLLMKDLAIDFDEK